MNLKANNCHEDLIDTLKDEIKFLRNEIVSKDKIIELMVKDNLKFESSHDLEIHLTPILSAIQFC